MEVPSVDPVVPVELGLRETPEVLDAVDVVALSAGELAVVVDAVVEIPIRDEAVIELASESEQYGAPLGHPGLEGEAKDRTGNVG
jgi:hypothetical protein